MIEPDVVSDSHNPGEINKPKKKTRLGERFRGFLPVVVDLETGGFNAETDALLELSMVILNMDEDGTLFIHDQVHAHIEPFEGANLEPDALEFTGIDPFHPLRMAETEKDAIPVLATNSSRTLAPRSAGCHLERLPSLLPPAVLTAATRYAVSAIYHSKEQIYYIIFLSKKNLFFCFILRGDIRSSYFLQESISYFCIFL